MTIATLKDFEIENIEEDYYTGSEFNGTWADNTCELCDVTITMYHDDKRYELSIKPADPGAYGSYGGDRSRGKGISTEILIDIIQQLTDEPDELTFENFVNNYFQEFGYSHEVKLKNAKDKYYLGKPINLITEPKPIKRLMPVYTFEELTPEQEDALFPEVPDYFIIDGKVYKPTIADHVEYYSSKVDDCSYYRITLNETTDSDTIKEVNKQLRKEGREELKQSTESWLNDLMNAHPWIDENGLVLQGEYKDGQIDKVRLTMNSQILATIDKEHPNKYDVEDWLNQLTAHKTFIEWIVNQTQWSIEDVSSLPNDIENIWISKPITLSESNTAQVTINIDKMNKTYVVKLAKPLDVDYIKAIVEFPVNDDDFVISLRPSTQVKCTSGFTLSEHIAVPDTTQLGSILKSGVKEARTALNKHNQ